MVTNNKKPDMNTIQRFCSLFIILLLTVGLSSQSEAQSLPEFGVKGGLNYSTFNDTEDVEYKTGFLIGGYANFKIPMRPVSVQPEVLYAQYGADVE